MPGFFSKDTQRSALAHGQFRRYLTCSACSTLATWLVRFLLGWQAWALTESAFWVGLASALMLIPALFLAPLFGVASDRVNARNGMLATIALQGLVACVAGSVEAAKIFSLPWLLGIATTIGVITSAHQPLRLALIPRIVPREALPSAVGLSAMVFNSARIIGPALGGWLLVHTGSAVAFFAAAAAFGAAVVAMMCLRGVSAPDKRPTRTSLGGEIRAGVAFVFGAPLVLLAFAYTLINGLVGRSVIELLPALSGKVLNGDPGTLAVLAGVAGAGSVIGGLIIARQPSETHRLARLVAVCLLLCTATLIPVTLGGGLVGLGLVVAGVSLTTTMVGTACQTITQLVVADELRGRVMSLWSVLTMAAPAFGTFLMGALADVFGFGPTLLGFALCAALLIVALLGKARGRHGALACRKDGATKS